jgi:hypothetical protein
MSQFIVLLTAAVCCVPAIQAQPAAAAIPTVTAGARVGDWMPYRTKPFELAAGTRCTFGLAGAPVRDRERVRTVATFPDGTPRIQEFAGPLVVRYTNTDTGATVRRNLTGRATVTYRPDGSFTETLDHGHLAVGLAPSDPGGPGFFVLTGSGFRLAVAATGRRSISLGTGRVENLCNTLTARS